MDTELFQLKNGRVYDMKNSSDILDYAIFITSSFDRLINHSLYNLSDNALLGEFYEDFQKEKLKYGYSSCHYPILLFKNTIIDREDQFTFNDYLFKNHSSSQSEKISKITALYSRIGKIISEISRHIDIEMIRDLPIEKQENFFKNLEQRVLICPDYNDKYIKIEGLFLKMLYSATGKVLSEIKVKMENELSGYLNFQVIKNKLVKAPLSAIRKSREDIVEKLIGIDTSNYRIFQKYESKLIIYGYLPEARNEWKKGAASLVRFYIHCEKKKIFPDFYKTSTKGISLLRELYTFYKGKDLNPPSKRRKQITPSTKGEFAFLDL